MQVCTLLQTDNHASTPPLSFLQAGCPSCRPTNSNGQYNGKAATSNATKENSEFSCFWRWIQSGKPVSKRPNPHHLTHTHTRLTALCLDRAGVAKYYRIAWWTATNTSASCYVEILWVRVIFSGCFRCPRYLPVFTSGYVSTGHLTWVWIWRVWHVNNNCKIIIKMPITATERENMHFATCV